MAIPLPAPPFILSLSKDIPSPSMGEGWVRVTRPFALSLSKDPVIARSVSDVAIRYHPRLSHEGRIQCPSGSASPCLCWYSGIIG